MIEDPSESGIDLVAAFLRRKANGSEHEPFMLTKLWLRLALADHEKFETMIELILEASRENDEVVALSRMICAYRTRTLDSGIADDMAFQRLDRKFT